LAFLPPDRGRRFHPLAFSPLKNVKEQDPDFSAILSTTASAGVEAFSFAPRLPHLDGNASDDIQEDSIFFGAEAKIPWNCNCSDVYGPLRPGAASNASAGREHREEDKQDARPLKERLPQSEPCFLAPISFSIL
jgi:hypothetical protein